MVGRSNKAKFWLILKKILDQHSLNLQLDWNPRKDNLLTP